MAFTPYLIKRFDYTHENDYFRSFSEKLRVVYDTKPGSHILIGNISCQGHQIDAIFIRSGQILIIDFKDYSGTLEFSETNPWKMRRKDGPLVFVAGGAQCRNPFQQVSAYRYALLSFLSDNSKAIVSANRTNIKWDHVNTMVLFQGDVKFDKNQLPDKIKRFFTVADKSSVFDQIEDRNSPGLLLNDAEIEAILVILDVRAENVFNPHLEPISIPERNNKVSPQRFEQLRRFISGNHDNSEIRRVLNYYRAIIEIERFKIPTASNLFVFPIDWRENVEFTIDPSANANFNETYLKNRQEQFPKNIFIGINVSVDGETRSLFHTIILSSDIQDPSKISFNVNSVELYLKTLEEFGLGEDVIEELTTAVNLALTLNEKLICVRNILGVAAELTTFISIGLSTESLFTAQLLSELKKLSQYSDAEFDKGVIGGFVQNKAITSPPVQLRFDPLISVTKLNASQERAVKLSFSQPLTVVTGPPGTGKSEVVLNIIANAISANKSVLFASKNNKAVDSVIERFGKITSDNYFLRFGSQNDLELHAKPQMTQLINHINAGNFNLNESSVTALKTDLVNRNNRIVELEGLLNSTLSLEITIAQQRTQLESLQKEYKDWKQLLNHDHRTIFIEQNCALEFDINNHNLLLKKMQDLSGGFLGKVLFVLFYKKDLLAKAILLNQSFVKSVQDYINENQPYVNPSKTLLNSLHDNCAFINQLQREVSSLKKENSRQETGIHNLQIQLDENEVKYERLVQAKPDYEAEIESIRELLPKAGKNYLQQLIKFKLGKASVPAVQTFKDFLPAHKLWKDSDVALFKTSCENFVKDFKAVSVTSLSVKNSFSLSSGLFDLLVIDEASQCDIASALPLLFRSKSAVIIGDPLQLKHITNVQKYEEDYVVSEYNLASNHLSYSTKSLYDYAHGISNKSNLESVFLDEHYRCHPDIISFSNSFFYQPRMGQELKIKTKPENFAFSPKGITWVSVRGVVDENQNLNQAEMHRAIKIAKQKAVEYPNASIGIATPFNAQYRAIFNEMAGDLRERVKVATVHSFQGDEKDIMIFSLVVSTDCRDSLPNFINDWAPYLLNVGITRARSSLIIVGNHSYCLNLKNGNSRSLLCQLAEYTRSLGRVEN